MGSSQSWPRAPADGGLSKQFARNTGTPLSAVDLQDFVFPRIRRLLYTHLASLHYIMRVGPDHI